MLAIATFYDYKIWQMDVKTAFLNGYLKEELYMMQLEDFVNAKGANKVCKLQRSIYSRWLADHRASQPKSTLRSHTWIPSQISWPQAILRNLGSSSLPHSS